MIRAPAAADGKSRTAMTRTGAGGEHTPELDHEADCSVKTLNSGLAHPGGSGLRPKPGANRAGTCCPNRRAGKIPAGIAPGIPRGSRRGVDDRRGLFPRIRLA